MGDTQDKQRMLRTLRTLRTSVYDSLLASNKLGNVLIVSIVSIVSVGTY